MKLHELLGMTALSTPPGMENLEVAGIAGDSREVRKGEVFVAAKGFTTDGHKYIRQALEAGALLAFTEFPVEEGLSKRIIVNPEGNNRKLLAELSAIFYREPWMELRTTGITGTNGKTSTAHMIRWILERNGVQTGIMGTIGHVIGGESVPADVTTPDSLTIAKYMRRMADSGDRACVMEVSSHAIALERVHKVRFDAAVFTNISQDHLDFHADMKEYLETKKKLFGLLKDNGRSIVGTYAPNSPSVPGAVTFGEAPDNTWTISEATSGIGGSSFIMQRGGARISVKVRAPGRFNVYNAAGAIAATVELGIPATSAAEALSSFRGVPGRMEAVDCGQDFLVAVDYAHTPDALERVLSQGKLIAANRLLAVFGCGGDRDPVKRPIMGRIAALHADIAIVTSDNPRTEDPGAIIEEILEGFSGQREPLVEPDRRRAIRTAIEKARAGDVVIIAGKGHEDYQILGREKVHFDDREQAAEALRERGYECTH